MDKHEKGLAGVGLAATLVATVYAVNSELVTAVVATALALPCLLWGFWPLLRSFGTKRRLQLFLDEERPSSLALYPHGRLLQFRFRRKVSAPFILALDIDKPIHSGKALLAVEKEENEEGESLPIKGRRIEFCFSRTAPQKALLTVVLSSAEPTSLQDFSIRGVGQSHRTVRCF